MRRNNGQKLPKYEEGNVRPSSRSLKDYKQGEQKEAYTKTHYNQIVKSQRQKKNLESSTRKVIHHIQGTGM